MCAGKNIMEKTLTEATQLLDLISKEVAMQRDWEEHISGSGEQETRVEVLADISRKEALKVEKEKAKQKRLMEQPTMEDQSKATKFASWKRKEEEV
jgi:hypothetical protein